MSPASLNLFDLVPGKVLLDRYLLKRAHRQSGMAATFEAADKKKKDAARELLAFPSGLFEDRDQAIAFAEKMTDWKKPSSPVLPVLRDIQVLEDGSIVLVTDFPPGASLRTWMKDNGRMEAEQAIEFGTRLLDGLSMVHEAQLVHGDIKPETIYFRPETVELVLVDAGVTSGLWAAKHLGTRTALIGTPYYAPLEQFSGDPPSVSSDLYNVATVLYELVAGVLPWTGKSFLEVFQSKMSEPPAIALRAPEADVPVRLEAALLRGLAPSQPNRYSTAEEFAESLHGAAS